MYRLSSKDLSDILNLINLCRSYLKNRGKIKDVLSKMLRLFWSNDAVFFSGNRDLNGIDWVNSFSLHGDRLYLAQYANYYWRYDPLYQTQFCPKPIKPVFKTDDIISYSQMAKLEYYNDFLRPQNQLGELIIRLCSGKKLFGVVALQRSKEQPHFDNRDIRKARILVPHLINTFETANLLSKIDEERKLLEQWLESQSEGIIFLDSELRPLYYNSRAKRVCLFLSGMTMEALHNAKSVDISIPSVIIKDCTSLGRPFEGDSLPSKHRIINTEHGKRYYIKYSLISPLSQELFAPCFVVFLKDLTRSSKGSKEVLSGNFRLSMREEVIAQYAGIGLTNKEIAEKLFISPFTVQNHLKSIFKKTGVDNRTQLANLVQ